MSTIKMQLIIETASQPALWPGLSDRLLQESTHSLIPHSDCISLSDSDSPQSTSLGRHRAGDTPLLNCHQGLVELYKAKLMISLTTKVVVIDRGRWTCAVSLQHMRVQGDLCFYFATLFNQGNAWRGELHRMAWRKGNTVYT